MPVDKAHIKGISSIGNRGRQELQEHQALERSLTSTNSRLSYRTCEDLQGRLCSRQNLSTYRRSNCRSDWVPTSHSHLKPCQPRQLGSATLQKSKSPTRQKLPITPLNELRRAGLALNSPGGFNKPIEIYPNYSDLFSLGCPELPYLGIISLWFGIPYHRISQGSRTSPGSHLTFSRVVILYNTQAYYDVGP